jgi:hypothetical protein
MRERAYFVIIFIFMVLIINHIVASVQDCNNSKKLLLRYRHLSSRQQQLKNIQN